MKRIALMKSIVGNLIKVKATGGIRDLRTLVDMYRNGAERFGLGISSAVKIIQECESQPGQAIKF